MSKISENFAIKYLRESKEELQKVTWPSQKDTIKYSITVAVVSIAAGVYFFFADWILSSAMEQLLNLTQ